MRISDWSSDVCSSDLGTQQGNLLCGVVGVGKYWRRESALAHSLSADEATLRTSCPFVAAGFAIVGGTQFVERCPYQQENRALFVPRGGVQDGSCHRKPYARRPLSNGVAGEGDGPWLSRSRTNGVERTRLEIGRATGRVK